MAGPPLPPGFEVEQRGKGFDPLGPLLLAGVEATNGYRTPQDIERLKAKGYKPAEHSLHLEGDAADLAPGKSGWSLNKIAAHARRHFGPDAKVLNEGDHIHVQLPGWGQAPGTPGTPRSGLPALPDGFKLEQRGSLKGQDITGVHDGDTVSLSGGRNGRVFGADAYELGQQGRRSDNSLVPLGEQGRGRLIDLVPGATATGTGQQSYGRPVVTLNHGGDDPAQTMIREGLALAEPNYLRGSPLFSPYMEAERLARQNLLGGHGTNAETPSQFRHKDGPWQGAEPGEYGKGQAIFGDEPTPFMGLRPEVEKAYVGFLQDPANLQRWKANPKAGHAEIMDFAKGQGFTPSSEDVDRFLKDVRAGKGVGSEVSYQAPPKLVTDPGDGAFGSFARGAGDPINMLDELGGIVDTVGLTPGRENLFNSDRRFGDQLWNNIDQNRSILQHDDEAHPVARISGQLASGLIIPIGGMEGVAARATAEALAGGASRAAAEQIAKRAVARRLAGIGGAEGAAAGAGAGEGNPIERLPNAALGAAVGATGGYVLGGLANEGISLYRTLRDKPDEAVNVMREGAAEAAPIVNDASQNAGPTPAARSQGQGGALAGLGDDLAAAHPEAVVDLPDGSRGVDASRLPPEVRSQVERWAAMNMEDSASPELVGPVAPLERQPDRIDVSKLPPMPEGFALEEPSLGRTARMDERPSPEAMAAAARRVSPADVISTGPNRVESLDEAQRANPGRFAELQAPNPLDELGVRRIGSPRDLFKGTRIRGPFDVTKQVRRWGGVQDQGGELSHLGITNQARRGLEFGGNEQFLGKLINKDGMTLDQLGERLWDEGWLNERPTTAEVIDILHREHLGESLYHPESLNEVGRFREADAEATRIAKARDEGSPLVEDRGEAISLEDLKKMDGPLASYEDRGTGRVVNINVDNLNTKEDIQRALQAVEHKFGGFDAARRGKVSNAETEALASELNMTADDLLRRRQGQALNAEQALAARQILAKSGDELVAMAKKVAAGGNGDADLAEFHKALLRHAAIQEQVTGATAEAGRALQAFKIAAKAKAHRGRVLKSIIEGAGGKHSLEDAAEAILELERVPGALNKFAVDAQKPTWKDKLVELWYNSLLSGPQTHAVNILSNSLTAALQVPEHLAAAAIGSGRAVAAKAFRNKEVDRVLLSEVGPRVVGLTQGAKEGLKAFRHTLRTGEVSDHITKVESARQEAISGIKGKIVRVPTHLLSAEDEFFKATARRMEIAGLAVRKARGEGLRGDKLKARIVELTANPTPEMVERSMDYARYLTFQRPLGPAMQNVTAITQKQPWLKLFVPFIRTPTNILKFAVERSPAAPLLKEVRADIKAGGAARDLALAKVALGTGLGMLVTEWVKGGHITGGGPADENAKRLMMADGWKPYSIKIGDKYYSYRRLDPLATTLGVWADMVDLQGHMTEKQSQEVPALLIASVTKNLENKTWLSGMSDVLDVIEDPQRSSHAFVERLAGSIAVPALASQTARTIDPVQRETGEGYAQGVLDSIKSRIPGLSQTLLPKRDVFGEEIANEGGLGPDLASPIWTGTAKNDPVVREALDSGATIGRIQNNLGGGKMPDAMFNEYQSIAGQLTKQYIQREISAPEWRSKSRPEKQKAIDRAKKAARKDARDALAQMEAQ